VPAEDLVRVRLAAAASGAPAWADGLEVALPRPLLADAGLQVEAGMVLRVPGDLSPPASMVERLRLRAAFTPPPASSRLPFSYRAVPGPVRRTLARAVGRAQRRRVEQWAAFPQWPIDVSADVLADWAAAPVLQPADGARRPTPVLLTHDIDSPDGLRNLVATFLPIEEAAGARSTSFIVPCAWQLDEGCLREAAARGHQLGIHGYDHSNRTPFATAADRRTRLDAARPLADRFAMIGYRAPSLLRTPALLEDLAGRYQYDSSIPTSGGLFPVPNNGCATVRPFRIGGLVEIPITLPRDGSLLFLGHSADEIVALWKSCADIVVRAGGVVVLLTHCERHFSGSAPMLHAYRSFLEWIRNDRRFAWSAPADVLATA
jgi:peptidoglycan/xylan/chitin deacetylase (PgdA/CDA1 family)